MVEDDTVRERLKKRKKQNKKKHECMKERDDNNRITPPHVRQDNKVCECDLPRDLKEDIR